MNSSIRSSRVPSSNRERLTEQLESYATRFPDEAEVAREIQTLVRESADCFERSRREGHITASCWIVDGSMENTLLTHHRKLNKWLQLGGHCDGDDDVLGCALREAREESGLTAIEPLSYEIFDIDIHSIPARGDEPCHLHYDIRFVFRQTDNAQFVISEESIDLQWLPVHELKTLDVDDSVQRMADKWLSQEFPR